MSRIPRLHVDCPLAAGESVTLSAGAAHRLTRVLRLGPGDRVILFNGDGADYHGRLAACSRRTLAVQIETRQPLATESLLPLTLALCAARGERTDWAVQKAVELGVHDLLIVQSERSVVRLDASRAARRIAHWLSVAVAAAEQCGRARVPAVRGPVPLAELAAQGRWDTRLVPDTAAERPLSAMPVHGSVCLLIGPEGGFSDGDRASAAAQGFVPVSLGPRVLRFETAAAVSVALLQAAHGDLGGAARQSDAARP